MAIDKKIVKKWDALGNKIKVLVEVASELADVTEAREMCVVGDLENALAHIEKLSDYFEANFPEVVQQARAVTTKRDPSKLSVKNQRIGERIEALMTRAVPVFPSVAV